jgi:serine/threonine protein kinase
MSKIVQDYMLVDQIGSGQYGTVWRAEHMKTKEHYAIKSISKKLISGQAKLEEFMSSEINALEQMNNRNIVKYYGKLCTNNNIYLIFEFCRDGTLEELLKKQRRLPEEKAALIFDQILNAFSELFRLKIMHRDLKPSNILIDNGEIKLADFGFCKKMKGEFEMTKSIVGSPIYMAPELLQGKYYCSKADIWSLGVLLYELLHGHCPYEDHSIPALLNRIKTTTLKIAPEISQELRSLLEGMLVFNSSSRISWNDLFKRLKTQGPSEKISAEWLNPSTRLETSSFLEIKQAVSTGNYSPKPSEDVDRNHYLIPLGQQRTDGLRTGSFNRAGDSYSSTNLRTDLYTQPAFPKYEFSSKETSNTQITETNLQSSKHTSKVGKSRSGQEFLEDTEDDCRSEPEPGDRELQEILKSWPLISRVNEGLRSRGLPQLPLKELSGVMLQNRRRDSEDYFEVLKARYAVKFITDKVKMLYLLDFEDAVLQNHMIFLLLKKARKYLLSAKIKVNYLDDQYLKEYILDPQQLRDYVEVETNEFDTLYSSFLKEITALVKHEPHVQVIHENIQKPFDLDDLHFKDVIKQTVEYIGLNLEENAVSVSNALLDIYILDSFIIRIVDYTEKVKLAENFINRLTNHEIGQLVAIKVELLSN